MQKLIKIEKLKKFKIKKNNFLMILILFLIFLFTFHNKTIINYVDYLLSNLGFSLSEVKVKGNESIQREDIIKHIKFRNCISLFCIDLKKTKADLEELNLVKNANVTLILPSKLNIEILEEKPEFILYDGTTKFLLNYEGKKIIKVKKSIKKYNNLIILEGKNVITRLDDLKFILQQSPYLSEKVTSAKLISKRRWALIISNNITIDLPEKNPAEAFKKLDFLDKKFGFLSDKLKIIDLRVKDRMIIKLNVGDTNFKESKV